MKTLLHVISNFEHPPSKIERIKKKKGYFINKNTSKIVLRDFLINHQKYFNKINSLHHKTISSTLS